VLDRPPAHTPAQPLSGADAFLVDPAALSGAGGHQHTQMPYVMGTSVLAIKYADGVLVAADTLGAYGSTKRYKSIERIKRVNDHVVVAASGEISDFQYIMRLLDELTTGEAWLAWLVGVVRLVSVRARLVSVRVRVHAGAMRTPACRCSIPPPPQHQHTGTCHPSCR
jgi:hypothetical protein